MHITFVSLSKKNVFYTSLIQSITAVTAYEVITPEDFSNTKIERELVFFDAEMGIDSILQQAYLFPTQNKQIKWLVTRLSNIHLSLQCLKAGASGIISTIPGKEDLQLSIQTVSENQLYLQDDLIQILALRQLKKILHPFIHLSAREFDVFCLLAEHYSIQTIAELLSISPKTAFNCQTQLRKKLNLENQLQLTQFAKSNGLIP